MTEDVSPPPVIQGLIFDCDGTLADTMPAHYRAWTATLAPYGLVFSEEKFYSWGGIPSHRIVTRLAAEQQREVPAELVAREKEAAFLRYLDAIQPVPAVVEIARRHRGQLPMAVASGGFRPVITRILTQLGILAWFDAMVTAEDTERHKPEPDVFLEAARRLHVPPRACAVYEDTDLGLEAARRAGMKAIDVRPLYARP
jgi:HAD superfamily hydrolase (TIGR01509 family)